MFSNGYNVELLLISVSSWFYNKKVQAVSPSSVWANTYGLYKIKILPDLNLYVCGNYHKKTPVKRLK